MPAILMRRNVAIQLLHILPGRFRLLAALLVTQKVEQSNIINFHDGELHLRIKSLKREREREIKVAFSIITENV